METGHSFATQHLELESALSKDRPCQQYCVAGFDKGLRARPLTLKMADLLRTKVFGLAPASELVLLPPLSSPSTRESILHRGARVSVLEDTSAQPPPETSGGFLLPD